MINIVVVQEKGGTGKSTISAEIVGSLKRTGTPSAFYDLDGQGGTVIKPYKDDDAVISVIDSPGSLQPKMGDWIKHADIVVIPTLCSRYDKEPLLRTLKIFRENRKPDSKLFIVLNRFTRWRNSQQFLECIHGLDTGMETRAEILTLPQSELFLQAGEAETNVVSYKPKSEPAKSSLILVNAIRKAAGLPEETV